MYGWYSDHIGAWAWVVMTAEVVLFVALIVLAVYLGTRLADRNRGRGSR